MQLKQHNLNISYFIQIDTNENMAQNIIISKVDISPRLTTGRPPSHVTRVAMQKGRPKYRSEATCITIGIMD